MTTNFEKRRELNQTVKTLEKEIRNLLSERCNLEQSILKLDNQLRGNRFINFIQGILDQTPDNTLLRKKMQTLIILLKEGKCLDEAEVFINSIK